MTDPRTGPRTIDDVLKDQLVIQSGRTRYAGQLPRDDELMVREIERLRAKQATPSTPLRWFVIQGERCLQQRILTPDGTECWVDVPVVYADGTEGRTGWNGG